MRTLNTTLLLTAALYVSDTQAITLSSAQLPSDIADCGTCYTSLTSTIDLGYMSVFDLVRFNGATSSFSHLIRYTLTSPSGIHSVSDYGMGPETYDANYTGYIWMEAPQYISGGTAQFNIYTDQISPSPDVPYPFDTNHSWTFQMNLTTAMSGSGTAYFSGEPDYLESGSMQVIDGMMICIECSAAINLNLVGLSYNAQGMGMLNPGDTRGLLLSYDDSWDLSSRSRDFYVQAVPAPAALWLFLSGAISILGFTRKKPH